MARGRALVEDVLPVLEEGLTPDLDSYASERLEQMREHYSAYIARVRSRAGT
jgi:hypothetical protein